MCPEETLSYYVSLIHLKDLICISMRKICLLYPFTQWIQLLYTFPEAVIATEKHFSAKERTLARVHLVDFMNACNITQP